MNNSVSNHHSRDEARPARLLPITLVALIVALTAILIPANNAVAQTTSFTYQGKLADGGSAANGQYDFFMSLWDDPTAGTQIGSLVNLPGTTVVNGVFTVNLDFGPGAFNGGSRFLQINVKPAGNPLILPTTLTPRQQVMSTPYAIKSLGAVSADGLSVACVNCVTSQQIQSVSADQVTAGTLTVPRGGTGLGSSGTAGNYLRSDGATWVSSALQASDVPDLGGTYVKNGSSIQSSANFNISGNGTAGGTLSANAVNANSQYNLNGSRILSNAGVKNLFSGISAGAANIGNYNSFFGSGAGQANTTGSLNTFLGADAGSANISGGGNSLFGYHAGFTNNGSNNSFFGTSAGANNSSGFNNAFFGREAGISNSTAHDNAFFGYGAGFSTNNSFNSFFGSGAGANNISGSHNSFFGYQSGQANTGAFNSFLGSNAGLSNTTGSSNVFLGKEAGKNNTTASYNTFVGAQAGFNSIGSNAFGNVFVGYSAGMGNTSGTANSFFGSDAGDSNVSGTNNTIIGGEADVTNSGLTNSTAIGYRAAVSQNNSLVLGSINGVNGATADTKVGIGTTAPSAPLTIDTEGNATHGVYGWVQQNGSIVFGSKAGGMGAQPYGAWIGTKTNHPLSIFVNDGGPLITFTADGYLHFQGLQMGPGNLGVCMQSNVQMLGFCSSSLRYKTDVQTFTGGMDIVSRLRPIVFNWKEGGARDLGFGAEEVEKIEPLLTFRNKKGEIEGVKYNQVSAVLVNAIKEQQAQIASQQTQIENLRATQVDNNKLQAQVARLSLRLARLERRTRKRR